MPRISIGLPVRNGERYLRPAVDSLLAQTFTDFEIVIGDNASTDGTRAIAEEFAARDPRVKYHRSEQNLGAAANFNRVFGLSRGELFKWAAHDDVCAPTFLERCIESLDRNPDAVLAHSMTDIIDADDQVIEHYDLRLPTDSRSPGERFESLLQGHSCFEVFGVIRRRALLECGPMGAYAHGDGVLLARLALRGTFAEVREPLFRARRHAGQSMSRFANDYRSWARWFDPRLSGHWLFPWWRIYTEMFRAVRRAPLDARTRAGCYRRLLRWINYRRDKLGGEVVQNLTRAIGRLWRRTPGLRARPVAQASKVGHDSIAA